MRMRLVFESLEQRLAMILRGPKLLSIRCWTLRGSWGISAQSNWGDGSSTILNVANAPSKGQLPYGLTFPMILCFFNVPERRQILQAAADIVFSKFSDPLLAITRLELEVGLFHSLTQRLERPKLCRGQPRSQ